MSEHSEINNEKNVLLFFMLACFFTVLIQPRSAMAAPDPVTQALERYYAESQFKGSAAIDTIFKHLDITTKTMQDLIPLAFMGQILVSTGVHF